MNGLEPRRLADDVALSLVFFTRLPLPYLGSNGRTLAQAIWAAPVAGFAVALIGAVAYEVATQFGLAAGPAAALALAAGMVATGCLHEDGLSDVADGFGGGRTRERKLEIMRDSRIGNYGAAALGLSLLLRWSALAELPGPADVLAALVAAHCASRALPGLLMHLTPPARIDGLSVGTGEVARDTALAGAALGAVALLLLGVHAAVVILALLALIFYGFRRLCLQQIGGQTGDTAGALQQLAEIAVLLAASAVLA